MTLQSKVSGQQLLKLYVIYHLYFVVVAKHLCKCKITLLIPDQHERDLPSDSPGTHVTQTTIEEKLS